MTSNATAANPELVLAEQIGAFRHDPLGYVVFAYPWSQPGPLEAYDGPDRWQRETLIEIGRQVRERNFDGVNPAAPVRVAISSGHGIGKAHPMLQVVETPAGPVQWGDLAPGDRVFGPDGKPVTIVARHDRGVMPMYRVTFDDGSSTLCGLDHLWNVRGRQQRRDGSQDYVTLSTEDIIERGVTRPNGSERARQWEIPVQGAVEYNPRPIGLHPYLVGLWLADGRTGKPEYSKPFPELVARLRSLGYDVSERSDGTTKCILGISRLLTDPAFQCGSPDRYIPDDYKYQSADNRRELLRGLLDGDGEVHSCGSIGYASTSPRLADDIIWLVRSLGGKAQLQPAVKTGWYPAPDGSRIACRDCYRVTIQIDWNPFTVEHRKTLWKASEARYTVRWIDSIEYSHKEDSMCITVARADGLYLANDFIVTHNSVLVAWLVDWIMSCYPGAQGTITANTYKQLDTRTWAAIRKWTRMAINAHWFHISAGSMTSKYAKSPKDWQCSPQSCREENSEAFAGQHAASSVSFYIFDEASAIPDKIFEVAEGGLTDGQPMIFLLGNPTRNSGKFHRVCFGSERSRWYSRSIDSREARFTNKKQVAEWIEDYGEDSDFVRVRVRGLPPKSGDLQFIGSETVYQAQQRRAVSLPGDPLIMGIDYSRGGSDKTVVRFRRGLDACSIKPVKIAGEKSRDSMAVATRIAALIEQHKPAAVFGDATGGSIGGPINDRLRQLGHQVIDVQYGGESPDPHYANMRTYIWARMRDWLDNGAIDKDADLEMDLTGPGSRHDKRDKVILESKDDMKKRGLDSPDDGDALANTFAAFVAPPAPPPPPPQQYYGPDSWMG